MTLVGYDFVVLVLHRHAYYETCITVLNNRHVSYIFFFPYPFIYPLPMFDIKASLIVQLGFI